MSLTKRHFSTHRVPLRFDPRALGEALRDGCGSVQFALLLGSARNGHVDVGSDIDLALFLDGPPSPDTYVRVQEIVSRFAPGAHCDIGFLNGAEPVYRFEALKGRLLFARDREQFMKFYSLACREYESQLGSYERQHRYRTGAA